MTYNEIIKNIALLLPDSRKWWPKFFYHFTNMDNAFGILEKGWIYGRNEAIESHLMKTENASPSVISITQNKIKEYARLYFRPRTPTQYHNEGYKPRHIRDELVNANCPVPIFFFFDSESVLKMDGVEFSEVSCAGRDDLMLLSGEDAFSKLPFSKIYHEGKVLPEFRDDIVKHRHAEVVRLGGLPIQGILKGIVCRSVAEKQTLLYLLKTRYAQLYSDYHNLIYYSPKLDLFFNNGIFVKSVEYINNNVMVKLNDKAKRYRPDRSIGKDFKFRTVIYYIDDFDRIIDSECIEYMFNYASVENVNIIDISPKSTIALIEIYFDDILMYKNKLDMRMDDLI